MDSFTQKEEYTYEANYISINQENNCIAVGTKFGFKIFTTDPFEFLYESKCGPIAIVEILDSTPLILIVGQNEILDFSPRKVTIFSTTSNSVICSTRSFQNKIQIVKANKQRMIILEKNLLHIYSTEEMKSLHTLNIRNVQIGKIILSPCCDKNNFICYSDSSDEGVVKIYDLNYLTYKTSITAHKSPISKMAINRRGDLLATCSNKGTIIRIFSLPIGEKIFTFKRGISNVQIYYMNFSNDSQKIIISSDSGTIHVFDLYSELPEGKEKFYIIDNINSSSNNIPLNNEYAISSYMTGFISNFKTMLVPKDYQDYIGVQRSSISYNNNLLKVKNIVSFIPKTISEAYCFTADGNFYLFLINNENKSITKIKEENIKDLMLIE